MIKVLNEDLYAPATMSVSQKISTTLTEGFYADG
jgi:hypothetical protein